MSHALVYLPGHDGWRERIVPVQVLTDARRVDCGPGTDYSGRRIEMRTVRVQLECGEELRIAVERLGTPAELAPVLAAMQPPPRDDADPVPLRERPKMTDAEKARRYRHRLAVEADPERLERRRAHDRERKRRAAELRAAATMPKKQFNTPFGRGLRG